MDRATRLFLLITLLVSFGNVRADAFVIREDFRSFQVPSVSERMTGPGVQHPDTTGKEYTFYPPRNSQPLWVSLSARKQTVVNLVLSTGTVEVKLPASPDHWVVKIVPSGGSILYSVSLSGQTGLYSGTENPVKEAATVYLEKPETLFLHIREEAGVGNELRLGISGSGPVKFSPEGLDAEDDPFFLTPFTSVRNYQFPMDEYRSSDWSLSPLSNIQSLSLHGMPSPLFPTALPRDGGQILDNLPEKWRHRDFEIYSWTALPEILVFDCLNYEIQNRFFRRLSYYVEKKGFSGTLMTNTELMNKHGWNAHDYRPSDLANFFNLVEDLSFSVYPEEEMLLNILLGHDVLKRDTGGRLVPGKGAVLSISRESSAVLRRRFFTHEASHGLYFVSGGYRALVRETWDSLDDEDRALWRFFLGWYGYDPEDEDLMINEFQAYLVQQSPEEAPAYFIPRLANLAVKYPNQQTLLNRRTGEAAVGFREWADHLGEWIHNKWGLETGNFSTLRKELP